MNRSPGSQDEWQKKLYRNKGSGSLEQTLFQNVYCTGVNISIYYFQIPH